MPSRFPKLSGWIDLFRLPNALIAGLGVGLGHACLPGPMDWALAGWGFASLALLAAAGNAQNDILDIAADRLNRPARPLPSGRLGIRAAGLASTLLYSASLATAYAIGQDQALLVLGMALLLFLYNLRLKAWPLWGNLAVSLLCALAVYFPEYPSVPDRTGLPMAFAFLSTLARELAKDAEDMRGDGAMGWSTFPLRFGEGTTAWLVKALLAALLLLLPMPYLYLGYHMAYIPFAALGILPLLALVLRCLQATPPIWSQAQRFLKWTMLAGMLAILAGVVPTR